MGKRSEHYLYKSLNKFKVHDFILIFYQIKSWLYLIVTWRRMQDSFQDSFLSLLDIPRGFQVKTISYNFKKFYHYDLNIPLIVCEVQKSRTLSRIAVNGLISSSKTTLKELEYILFIMILNIFEQKIKIRAVFKLGFYYIYYRLENQTFLVSLKIDKTLNKVKSSGKSLFRVL